MLAIAIDYDYSIAACMLKTGKKCGFLSEIAGQPQTYNPGVLPGNPANHLVGTVTAAIINQKDLIALIHAVENLTQPLYKQRQHLFLIKKRDYNA